MMVMTLMTLLACEQIKDTLYPWGEDDTGAPAPLAYAPGTAFVAENLDAAGAVASLQPDRADPRPCAAPPGRPAR